MSPRNFITGQIRTMPDLQNIASHNGTEPLQSLFRPNASKSEVEDVHFDLPDVVTLELQIDPAVTIKKCLLRCRPSRSLTQLRIECGSPHSRRGRRRTGWRTAFSTPDCNRADERLCLLNRESSLTDHGRIDNSWSSLSEAVPS